MTRYKQLQQRARKLGADTINDRNSNPMGYWLVDKNGNGVWPDGNFAGSLAELESLIETYKAEQLTT